MASFGLQKCRLRKDDGADKSPFSAWHIILFKQQSAPTVQAVRSARGAQDRRFVQDVDEDIIT
jgi:hypothetical protein